MRRRAGHPDGGPNVPRQVCYPRPPLGRGRTRPIRLALTAALVVVAAGVVAATASGLAFVQGDPCQDTQPLFVCPAGSVGASYSITLKPSGGNGPPYTYYVRAGSLPAGLSLDSNTGVISGTPTVAGAATFGLELQDKPEDPGCLGCGCVARHTCAYRDFQITILAGLSIDNQSIPAGTIGQQYSQALSATVITATNPRAGTPATGVTWSLSSGTLPPGIALSPDGILSGAPTTEGAFQFVVKAQRDAVQVDTETFSLSVRQPLNVTPAKPFATPPAPTAWEVGVPFSAKLTPAGGSGTYTFAAGTGTLPTGLVLGPEGTISGTPRTAGVYRATVKVSDSEGRSLDYPANFGVAARLAVSTLALKPGKVGRLYRAKLASTGGLPVKTWKVATGPLPKGLRLDRTLGVVSGTPKKAGSYRVTFQVTDGLKVVAAKTLRLTVLGA